ncbi:unnamed protein product [Chondrus crispus]|uniref:Uncharacterized protein n=1 Tax=Chondrus crispus TaxID=2769 RepID=R7QKB8_CHOCR|nr:unnamed protein product [Chondrus crispus]CDF38967.1 unnamed protein product [Chondrus crispus]|eukprot:XP_005718872.1 unnamed protein product [Chondrus crispus]
MWASTVFHHATLERQYVAAAALASQVNINVDLQILPIARQMSAWRVPSQAGRPK